MTKASLSGLQDCLGISGRSSRIRHRNALTERVWKDAVQGLGKADG